MGVGSALVSCPGAAHCGEMGLRQRLAGLRQSWQASHDVLFIPLVLILVITAVDIHVPEDVHLGPALVIAPAITASFAGPLLTGCIGALALTAQVIISVFHGGPTSTNHVAQIVTLAVLTVLIVSFSAVRERRSRQLAQVRSVAEAAQHVLLWPLPEKIGPLQMACLYLAAEDEAQIGGDLYAATRTNAGVRVMIGDVRGKGLSAIGEASLVLGAFREAAYQHTTLPELAAALEQSVTRYLADFEPPDEAGERFATTLLLEIPDDGHITRRTTASMWSPSSPETPSCSTPTASSKPATPTAASTRSASGPANGPTAAPRRSSTTSAAISSPTSEDASATTPHSSPSTALPHATEAATTGRSSTLMASATAPKGNHGDERTIRRPVMAPGGTGDRRYACPDLDHGRRGRLCPPLEGRRLLTR